MPTETRRNPWIMRHERPADTPAVNEARERWREAERAQYLWCREHRHFNPALEAATNKASRAYLLTKYGTAALEMFSVFEPKGGR